MRKGCLVGLLFLFCPFLVGMSGLGGSGRIGVPEPPRNYEATIIDRSDVSTRVEKLSFEGQTAIVGRLGSGHVSIGFDKIASIQFILEDKTLKSQVLLKDGKTVSVIVDKGMACYGKLPYGEFEIAMEDIRAITIHGEATEAVTERK